MTGNGLQERMEALSQKQQICLNVQKLLTASAVIFYRCAVILLPVHMAVLMVLGGTLTNKATSLAREKYPYVLLRAGRFGKGEGWDPYILQEAGWSNDQLTVNILRFGRRTVYCFLAALLGNTLMWCLSAALRLL